MKILHIINNLDTGGAEKLLVELAPLLNKKANVKIGLLNSSATPLYNQLLIELGSDSIITLSSGSLYNPLLIFKVRKFLRKYDIVHVHLFPAFYYVSIAAYLSGKKARLIFTEHGTSNRRINSKFFNFIDRIIYKKFDTVVAITPDVKTVLEKSLGLYGKVKLVYNGINLKKIEQAFAHEREQFSFQIDDVLLIQVSRFSYEKDQKTVIRSLLSLPFNVKLILVGDGVQRKGCELLASELQLENRVTFLGLRADVPELLKMSDIVVQSSISEGFGLAALEGMGSGKPVIASDIPGLRTIVADAGLIFEMGNSEDLASKIQALIRDTEYFSSITRKCQDRAKQFNINSTSNQLLNIYEKA